MGDPNRDDSNIPESSSSSSSSVRRIPVRRRPQVLLGACGCDDAVKFGVLCEYFSAWAKVDVVYTQSAESFINAIGNLYPLQNADRTSAQYLQWADVMVIAPLSAHTLAKIARGFSDNKLTEIVRGWDPNKPLYVAPSMDYITWNNPLTAQQRQKLVDELAITIIEPSYMGEMADPSEISYTVKISNEEIWDYVYC